MIWGALASGIVVSMVILPVHRRFRPNGDRLFLVERGATLTGRVQPVKRLANFMTNFPGYFIRKLRIDGMRCRQLVTEPGRLALGVAPARLLTPRDRVFEGEVAAEMG
jgi:hypothetical protein